MKLFRSKIFLVFIIGLLVKTVSAQDVNCTVEVDAQQISNTDRTLFESLENNLYEFVNNRKWTTDKFKAHERIEFSILLRINEASGDRFKGNIQIQSRRPVYGSSYSTPLINHKDDEVQFEFAKFDVLQFSEQAAKQNNLTAIFAFYTYLVIGFDYDSFSPEGGDKYLNKALNIANQFQGSDISGWEAFKSQTNRYWIATNYLDSRFENLRTCMYEYHRQGMDQMMDDPTKARENIYKALEKLQPIYDNLPNNINMRLFFNAKANEIVNIFSEAPGDEQRKVVNLLNKISPANSNKWSKISG
ncbi:type IX secretion system protein PorD [Salibacter halophilus]|uniref:DUF4835 family protein n=1 Tax=Salibacter halophilus TaxID=1803916 RepID=A0A6N6M6X3_9FLAO|nr:DUF4835 family protein [Salibacter halophilus]KAB1065664.1 DUF4835 family protein [Salibacter halophilus]